MSDMKKQRKFGRNKAYCDRYTMLGRQISNKARRMKRHIKRHPNDAQAKELAKA